MQTAPAERRGRPGGGRALSPDEIRRVRWLWDKAGFTQQSLAEMYGISNQAISKIVRREAYRDIPDEEEVVKEQEQPMPTDVISMNTHPARGKLTAAELDQLVIDSVGCTLCNATQGHPCQVYQEVDRPIYKGTKPRIGEPTATHKRRIKLAYARGIL